MAAGGSHQWITIRCGRRNFRWPSGVDAAPREARRMAQSNPKRVPWPRPGILVAVGAAALVMGCTNATGQPSTLAPGPSSAGMASAVATARMSTRPMPSGGISEEQAVSIAQKAAPLSAVFESAEAGPLASVLGDDPARIAEGLPIKGDHEVWVVRFRATAAPCPPGGSTCESPRHGTVTAVVDYVSG